MAAVSFEMGSGASRTDWDATSLELLATTLERWQLTPGQTLTGGVSALVLEVTQANGSPAVLKLGFPHVEAIGEALGLEAFGPELAPRVLRQDAWTWALLLESVMPGTSLLDPELAMDDALAAAAALHTRLTARRAPGGIPTLASAMSHYSRGAVSRLPAQLPALESLGVAELVRAGIAQLGSLAADDVPPVLLHGDFNPNNVLRSGDGWRVIDPKPLVGDPAYDLWPLVAQLPGETLRYRVGRMAELTGLSAERIVAWGLVRTALDVSWALEDGLDAEAQAASLREWSALTQS
ncbi:aminoglycoside phosphotransferase family protein [Glaciihabitans arcticus]|nr:aminoglycoside phosphotransferase family protein [Glaciihabitans arcticus]